MQHVSLGCAAPAASPQGMPENCAPLMPGLDAAHTGMMVSGITDQVVKTMDINTIEHQFGQQGDAKSREQVIAAVRQMLLSEVDMRVQEKADQVWLRGRQMLSASQTKHKEKTQAIAEQLAECQKKQQAQEADTEKLKQVLTGLANHFSMLGAVYGGEPSACGAMSVGIADADTVSPNQDVAPELFSPGVFTPATDTSIALDAAATAAAFAEIPDFPFAAQCLSPATPLSLSETIAGPPTPQTLSLANSLTPASSAGTGDYSWTAGGPGDAPTYSFSFTLRKAEGADLGLNVSHHEFDRVLRVEGVRPQGAVEAWNRQCASNAMADKVLLPGDTIVSVNEVVHEPRRMLEECRDRQTLKFTVVRALACGVPAVTAAPPPRARRAEASEFVPLAAAAAAAAGPEELVDYAAHGDAAAAPGH